MLIRILLIMVVISISSFAHQVSKQRLDILSKGIGIPHWYWMRSSEALIDHFVNDADIETMVELGIRHVRIPFEMSDLDKPRIVEQFKKDIKRFTNHKIGVIVSAFGHKYNRDLISSADGVNVLKRFCSIIKETSPDYVFLQIANEPLLDEPKKWSSIQEQLLQVARLVLPHHTLITSTPLKFGSGPSDWDMMKAFHSMVPAEDQNVVYAFHFYEPYFFTHQNVDWDPKTRHIKRLAYPTVSSNVRTIISSLPRNTPQWIIQTLSRVWDKNKLREKLTPILEWRENHQRPVMVTEFGVYKPWADSASRRRWLGDMVSLFNEESFPWSLWDYDGGFGLFNIEGGFRKLDADVARVLNFTIPSCNQGNKIDSEE